MLHWLLIALGWLVVACGGVRCVHLYRRGYWVRGLMVTSWVVLAAGISVMALVYDGPVVGGTPVKALFAVGLGLGSIGLVAAHFLPTKD